MKRHRTRTVKLVWLFLFVAALALLADLSMPAVSSPPVPTAATVGQEASYINANLIRVGISDDAMTGLEYPETRLTATGPYQVRDLMTDQVLWQGQPGQVITVTVDKADYTIQTPGETVHSANPLKIQPLSTANRLKIVNITRRGAHPDFRGYFEIHRGFSSPAKLSVVNVVSLEDYLKAVVPNELPMRYGEEAVKAQAIAARNYAIRPREKPWPNFDICDSQYCQVYLGAQTETPGSNRTIGDTDGLVAVYDGEPILALFSSSHGGYGESYAYAFSDPKTKQYPAPEIPYLAGGPDVPVKLDLTQETAARAFWTDPDAPSFDVNSPYYRWKKQWSQNEITETINRGLLDVSQDTSTKDFVSPLFKPGDRIGTLKRVSVNRRGISGKAMIVKIEGSNGTWTIEKEFLIRKVFSHGGRMLPSANVVFSHLADSQGRLIALVAEGGGFGHGVGLSQLGASYMDAHGKAFPEIIQHYYKGVAIGSIPVSVGGATVRPVMASFTAPGAKGTLWVEADDKAPVQIRVNDHVITVTPTGKRTTLPVSLQAGKENRVILFPDEHHAERPLKVWVEVIPARRTQTGV